MVGFQSAPVFYTHGHPKRLEICRQRLTGAWRANKGKSFSLLDCADQQWEVCCKSGMRASLFPAELLQQADLRVVQLLGQVHIDLVGVYQALGLVPESVQLLPAVGPDVHDFGGGI